jgi:4-diphosphocytidyl-2-C-methyl-D-erythritol kinase
MKAVRVPAYAKVNLCLEVLRRRSDGYHELRTIFQAISLHDTLRLEAGRGTEIKLHIVGNSGLAGEPARQNLVYRALDGLRHELGWRSGIRAVLTKRIPVGRGLGGGRRWARKRNLSASGHSPPDDAGGFSARNCSVHA